ncbi:MAG TPA: hypothetical protein DEF61_03050 [Firmicutes bacterium]|nr:hypothetical protein [Bacillota bacterium]
MNLGKTKKTNRHFALKTELFVTTFILMLLFVAGLFTSFMAVYFSSTEEVYRDQVASTSEETINNFEIYIDNVINISNLVEKKVNSISLSSEIKEDKSYLYFDELMDFSNEIRFVSLYKESGELFAKNTYYHSSESLESVLSSKWFKNAKNEPLVNSFSKIEEGNYFTLSKFIKTNEGDNYVLRIQYSFDKVISLIKGSNLGEGGHVLIYDKNYDMVYSSIPKIDEKEISSIKNMVIGQTTFSINDSTYYLYVSTIQNTGWRVAIANNFDAIVNAKESIIIIFSVECVSFIVVFLLLIYLITNQITKPLVALEKEMAKVESFDFKEATKEKIRGTKEVISLNQSYIKMLKRIQELAARLIEEEKEQNKAELLALQNQINPHFLYNTLDSILLLIDKGDNENAGKMIVALSRFFRISISRGKNIIPVTSELDHVNYYLKIQKMRFKDNFAYELNYDKNEIAPYFVMKLILQPIVENAIVHGIGEHPKENAKITIQAKVIDPYLIFKIHDNGYGILPEKQKEILSSFLDKNVHVGVGLSNVYHRIKLFYGPKADIKIESKMDVGTTISILLPLEGVKSDEEK